MNPCSLRRTHASARPRGSRPSRNNGYVLLFVLGLVAVVGTLVLSLTVGLRLDAQLLAREKSALQEEYLMRGAAQYAALELGITASVDSLKLDPKHPALRDWVLWRPAPVPYAVSLGTAEMNVLLEDISDFPDANSMTTPQWDRLLRLVGVAPEAAGRLAIRIVELRQNLVRVRGTAGFSSMDELLGWHEIPAAISEFVTIGTKSVAVDLNSTSVTTLQFLGEVSAEKLQQLAKMRSDGPIAPAQAQAWLQGTGLTATKRESASPKVVRAHVSLLSSAAGRWGWVATIASENGGYYVVDQTVDRGLSRP